MGFIAGIKGLGKGIEKIGQSDFVRGLTGSLQADATRDATSQQLEFGQQAIDQLREDLGPVRGSLDQSLPQLMNFLNPQTQADFVTNNPILNTLGDQAQQRVFQNQALQGKFGSGGTAVELQNQLVPIGLNMLNNRFNQLFNTTQLGANAAARQGTTIADLLTQQGNAASAGTIGAANAQGAGARNLLSTGTNIASIFALSDERYKKDIKKIGVLDNGLTIYSFKYKDGDETQFGVMAQEVEKKYPEAVTEIDAVKYVDYEVLSNAA